MKKEVEYIIDDSPVVIPDCIKKMSKKEIDAEIERFEEKGRMERERLRRENEMIIV